MSIIPSMETNFFTSESPFYYYLLIVDSYSKITKTYGIVKITKEEVMDKLDMFQARFG